MRHQLKRRMTGARLIAVLAGMLLLVAACDAEDVEVVDDDVDDDVEAEEPDEEEEEPDEPDEPDEDDEPDEPDPDGDVLRVGALATLEGPFALSGESAIAGVEMAVDDFGGEIAGREIELIVESTDGTPDVAVERARRLVEQEDVDVIVGPLSGSEGIAIKDYAPDVPDVTIVNGSSAAAETTLENPADNFFRFSLAGDQWMAGLGEYAYNDLGFSEVATLGEDYSFPYTQVGFFLEEFCGAGGTVADRQWVPVGTTDYSSVIAGFPDVDAVYVSLGAEDALDFQSQYAEFGLDDPILAGSTTVDQTVLSGGDLDVSPLEGAVSAGPVGDLWDDPEWDDWRERYFELQGDDALDYPSLFTYSYWVNAYALFTGIEEVDADLDDGQEALQQALSELELDTPTGPVSLDENRQAIGTAFVTEVVETEDGEFALDVLDVNEQVEQGDVIYDADTPEC